MGKTYVQNEVAIVRTEDSKSAASNDGDFLALVVDTPDLQSARDRR